MLYELIGIVRPGKLSEVKEIAKTAGTIILNNGGVVRGITNWGTFLLPKPYRKHGIVHHTGQHFIMRFDSSPLAQNDLRKTISLDPRLLRHSVIKMGSTLDDIKNVGGKVEWKGLNKNSEDILGSR